VIDLRWSGDLPAETFARVDRAVKDGTIVGARLFAGEVRVPATIGDPTPVIAGADGAPLRLAPGGFAQANEAANLLLASRVRAFADEAPAGPCLELYAGAGNLTVLLAQRRDVVAVESDRDACAAARANLAARGLSDKAKVIEGSAADAPIAKGTRLVVLDPPRAGAKDAVVRLAGVPAVIYVSCDPPTLGRDLRLLAERGFDLVAIETFEMFPQTSHVETVAFLRKTKKGEG
jgi:23S rRNA (uracil1939-C5)-methyltransferase